MAPMSHDGPQGLAVSADGYTLVPASTSLTPGAKASFFLDFMAGDVVRTAEFTVVAAAAAPPPPPPPHHGHVSA